VKIVSMVPSWTETLLACGCEVSGRTRFCIHPAAARQIPVVGGTKTIDWDRVRALHPDLLLLDREENTRAMHDESPFEAFATHITSVRDVAPELDRLALRLGDSAGSLRDIAARWSRVATAPRPPLARWRDLPGVIEWLRPPDSPAVGPVAYLIWREPWMAIGPGTFIASMLEAVGVSPTLLLPPVDGTPGLKYPTLQPDSLPRDAVLLASSEPYPFHRKPDALLALDRPVALVDGESFSWFGVRSLRFLESGAP
jgi:hypothetical protein